VKTLLHLSTSFSVQNITIPEDCDLLGVQATLVLDNPGDTNNALYGVLRRTNTSGAVVGGETDILACIGVSGDVHSSQGGGESLFSNVWVPIRQRFAQNDKIYSSFTLLAGVVGSLRVLWLLVYEPLR
jgi:hypothetical protein